MPVFFRLALTTVAVNSLFTNFPQTPSLVLAAARLIEK